jgi:hypothetical protein
LQRRQSLPLTAISVAFVGSHQRLTGAQLVAVQLLLRSFGVVDAVRYARAQGKTVVVVARDGEQRWL